ncbi:Phosphotriesterase-related protein, partial [Orchesella cincta]
MPLAVTSVTGPVNVDSLGAILTHEHLHMQFDCALQMPPKGLKYPSEPKETFALHNLGVLRQYPYSSKYNTKLDDADSRAIMLDEVLRYKSAGGGTIVENTVEGIGRNLGVLKQLSVDSGVTIIAGTGFYVAAAQSHSVLNYKVEDMYNIMMKELLESNKDGIKCGIVGEIGSSWPIEEFEKRAIQATAQIQLATKKPITFHPGRHPEAPFEIMRIFTEEGGNPEDVVMSHLDRTIFDEEQLLEFAKYKTFTQYDLFGTEVSYYQLQESIDFISDAQRIYKLKFLKDNGHLDQITVSHDIHTKHRLANFGGHGFAHFLQNIVPKMRLRGFTEDEINAITSKNPKRWLSQGAEKI